MKKLLRVSFVLTTFSVAILVFQLSCKKEAEAQQSNYSLPKATTSTLGGVIIGNGLNIENDGTLSVKTSTAGSDSKNIFLYQKFTSKSSPSELWISNYDGTENRKIPIALPTGFQIGSGRLTSDGTKVILEANNEISSNIYSCSLDGSSLKKIIDGTNINSSGNGAYYEVLSAN